MAFTGKKINITGDLISWFCYNLSHENVLIQHPKRCTDCGLSDEVAQLKHQLDWLKRQLFGRKSEKVLVDNPAQSSLFDEGETQSLPAEAKPVKAHTRSSQKQLSDADVNDGGLRFDDTVPQQIIDIPAPELQGAEADQYELVDTKETFRLAQQPGSYVVLRFRRQVVRHKTTQTIKDTPAPSNVLEGCYCDASLLA